MSLSDYSDIENRSVSESVINLNNVTQDDMGIRGYLSMRQETRSHHRMKRFYCQIIGTNFFRYNSFESMLLSNDFSNSLYECEIFKIELWDGKGMFHRYKNPFKIQTTHGITFNIDAESAQDKEQWISYIELALKAIDQARLDLSTKLDKHNHVLEISAGGLQLTRKKIKPPGFKNSKQCSHPGCTISFDTSKRQHHCRNCGSTVCYEHSSSFSPLAHIGYLDAVRTCTSCFRVQRFILLLRTIVQIYMVKRIQPLRQEELKIENVREVEELEELMMDPDYGMSDLLQSLHLHRRGCDQAFKLIADKLIELSFHCLEDFEFFLPQIFHMWTTFDISTNLTKSALLFKVLMTAARHHVRLAQLLYWYARAAIDDSIGLGYGQNEKPNSIVFRRFPLYKMLLINIDLFVAGPTWKFQNDDDLKATPVQAEIIQVLFDQIQVLQEFDGPRIRSASLGNLCAVIEVCSSLGHSINLNSDHYKEEDISRKLRLANFFRNQLGFIKQLCDMAECLRFIQPSKLRKSKLPEHIQKLKLPPLAFFPLGSCHDPISRIVNIPIEEGTVFSTKSRAPVLIFLELQRSAPGFLDSGLWYGKEKKVDKEQNPLFRRSESKMTHDELSEMVLKEMRSRKNSLPTVVSDADLLVLVCSEIDQNDDDSTFEADTENKNEEYRGRVFSVPDVTSHNVDDIIDACETVSKEEIDDLPRDVEKFSIDQLESIASCMSRALKTHTEIRSETNKSIPVQCFTGEDAVAWMIANDIAVDSVHAIWVGNEMLGAGLLYEFNYEKPFQDTKDLYVIDIPDKNTLKLPGEQKRRQTLPGPVAFSDGNTRVTTRLISPHRADLVSNPSVPYRLDDDESISSILTIDTLPSILDNFDPQQVKNLFNGMEEDLTKLSFQTEQEEIVKEFENKMKQMKEQMLQACDYVEKSRIRHQAAVVTAFGERYETTVKRIQQASAFGKLEGWDCTSLIVKSNDDLRQEAFCLQLIRQFQDIFDASGLNLRLLPYSILPTSASTGVIEVIKNALSLDALKKRASYNSLGSHFRRTYGGEDSPKYKSVMQNYVRSMAAYSLVCYFLQVKDRHNGNIMLDADGHIVHIDYGFILGIAPGGRFSLETAPFKLTSEMVDAMGGNESDYYKEYIVLLIEGFLALQRHADTILMMIAIMAQDATMPCFKNRMPRQILTRTKALFKLDLDHHAVIKYVLRLVHRSQNSYRTRQYDKFQKISNGIAP